jgi:phosphoribosylformimino-5-aminoimidazole carboxamide ribotide isomerase
MNDAVFTIFPAIDLRAGQVVRLKEGDPNREKRYSTDPSGTALRWMEAGAGWLHVVNLDGAFGEASSANYQALQAILVEARRNGVRVQFGGGLRSLESIRGALEAGADRVVLGTLIVEQPEVLAKALDLWGSERIAAGIDARDGRVQVRGWQHETPLLALDLARSLREQGLRWLIFTDIARDGLQTGLNLAATTALARESGLLVVASGGVSRIEEIRQAKDAGLAGVIVGRALYEGSIDPLKLFSKEMD